MNMGLHQIIFAQNTFKLVEVVLVRAKISNLATIFHLRLRGTSWLRVWVIVYFDTFSNFNFTTCTMITLTTPRRKRILSQKKRKKWKLYNNIPSSNVQRCECISSLVADIAAINIWSCLDFALIFFTINEVSSIFRVRVRRWWFTIAAFVWFSTSLFVSDVLVLRCRCMESVSLREHTILNMHIK